MFRLETLEVPHGPHAGTLVCRHLLLGESPDILSSIQTRVRDKVMEELGTWVETERIKQVTVHRLFEGRKARRKHDPGWTFGIWEYRIRVTDVVVEDK